MASSSIEIKAAAVLGPTAVTNANTSTYQDPATNKVLSMGAVRGVVRVATAITNQTIALPTVTVQTGAATAAVIPLQGKFLRIKNESPSYNVEFAFGVGSAPTLVYAQLSTFASMNVGAGWRLGPNEWIDVVVPMDATHLSHIMDSAGAASTLAIYCSEGPVGSK